MEDKKQKRWKVPQELIDVFDEYGAAVDARSEVVKRPFKFQMRNAIYLGKIARQKHRKFWGGIRKIYPELDITKRLMLDVETWEVYLDDKT